MELTKIINSGNYKFEIAIKSKSEHAHSLMTDNKDDLTIQLCYLSDFILNLIAVHKETKR